MTRKALAALLLCSVFALVGLGCGGESGPGPKPGEQPNDKQAGKEKMKYGAGDNAVPKSK